MYALALLGEEVFFSICMLCLFVCIFAQAVASDCSSVQLQFHFAWHFLHLFSV